MTDRLTETVALLDRLIAYPTVSSDSNTEMIADLAHRLESLGARVETMLDPTGHKANLFASFGPDCDGGIVLSGHTDVVPAPGEGWTTDPFVMRQSDGRLYGRGTCDMKGFIAAAVTLAQDFAALPLVRPLHLAFTYDEEVGCFGARHLIDVLGARDLRPTAAIIGEPTGMEVVVGHKGCCEYTTRFDGLEGHGSNPEAGVNAVEYAVRFAARLMELSHVLKTRPPPSSPFTPPWTTINIGGIAGGTGHNVIAGHAKVDWEMRPVSDADFRMVLNDLNAFCDEVLLPEMQAVHAASAVSTETIGEVAGLAPVADNAAARIMADLTGRNATTTVPFGTEAGIFTELGLAAVVCGPGSIAQAHKPDEYLEIAQLDACLTALSGLAGYLTDQRTAPTFNF